MLGPEEEGKISHVIELEISERSKDIKEFPAEEEGKPPIKKSLISLFREQLALNKPKKGKKGKKGAKKKKK